MQKSHPPNPEHCFHFETLFVRCRWHNVVCQPRHFELSPSLIAIVYPIVNVIDTLVVVCSIAAVSVACPWPWYGHRGFCVPLKRYSERKRHSLFVCCLCVRLRRCVHGTAILLVALADVNVKSPHLWWFPNTARTMSKDDFSSGDFSYFVRRRTRFESQSSRLRSQRSCHHAAAP